MEIVIEKAETSDSKTVIDLLKALYLELGDERSSIEFLNTSLVHELMSTGQTEVYLVKSNEKELLGVATLTQTQAFYAGGCYGLLDEMYILPKFRSAKVGKQVIDKLAEIARHKGWKRMDVTAPTSNNQRAVKFYEACGFAFTGPKLKIKLEG